MVRYSCVESLYPILTSPAMAEKEAEAAASAAAAVEAAVEAAAERIELQVMNAPRVESSASLGTDDYMKHCMECPRSYSMCWTCINLFFRAGPVCL